MVDTVSSAASAPASTAAKRERPGDEARERIMEAALEQFSLRGFDATSVQKVADAAGMSKQALMHHYPSKERLRLAVMERLADRWNTFFPVFLAELTSERFDRYRHLVDIVGDLYQQNAVTSRFIARELLDRPEETMAWLMENGAPWLKVVTDLTSKADNPDPTLDVEAHVMVLSGLQLAMSAFVFSNSAFADGDNANAWRSRLAEAAKRVIRKGSNIDHDQEPAS